MPSEADFTPQKSTLKQLQELLAVARGDAPAELVLKNANIVNVFNGEITVGSVAIHRGKIAGVGVYQGRTEFDLDGRFLSPGLIEGHIHIESSKLTPPRFAELAVPHGTTSVIADPHEIANVLGLEGIRYMIRQSKGLPLDIFFMLPSCVPATSMETSGAVLSANDLKILLGEERVIGIAELMNFPGAMNGDESVLSKALLSKGILPIDGHAPGLSGRALNAYIASGPSTDHECNSLEEAREKLSFGMRVMIRQGSTAKNLKSLIALVTPDTERRCLLVSDDRRPGDLLEEGHLDYLLRIAVQEGVDPITAIRMVTLNTAEAFHLYDRGGIRPGWIADLVVFENLEDFRVTHVWKNGHLVASEGDYLIKGNSQSVTKSPELSIPILSEDAFQIKATGSSVRVIGVIPDQIYTSALTVNLSSGGEFISADSEKDIAKLAVIERHSGSGRTAVALVHGIGLKEGAIGSTVSHDSHNLIVCGMDDKSMLTAVKWLKKNGGGQVATLSDKVLAGLPLPIAGLMSDLPSRQVADAENELMHSANGLGSNLSDPFMALSFLALPVIPELKLTDHGLFDVNQFKHVPLFT